LLAKNVNDVAFLLAYRVIVGDVGDVFEVRVFEGQAGEGFQ